MSNEIGWHHPIDESDQWDGFNDSGIETFAGTPLRSLAREIAQNSLDAAKTGLVDVRFRLLKVETASIPNIDELRANLEACYEASKMESRKEKVFFEAALEELAKKTASVLAVADFNTSGMKGPSQNGTPFYAFMKAKGQSRKESDTATGSYGIGKFAPYSSSLIRTIFVSTVYKNGNGGFDQLTQGKSILMSHDLDGQRRLGAGFWGVKKKCRPIEGVSADLPNWIQRVNIESELVDNEGSTLYVLCFDPKENWEEYLAVSVAENFFGAISKGQLRIDIDGKYVLDQSGISDFFERSDIRKLIKNDINEPNHFDNCKNYLSAITNKAETIVEESERLDLGNCQVRILVGEGLPKKVCALRNGMFITDSLNGLKSFSDFKEFVAVFSCRSTKGNELLRAMEPPKHDDFEPDRLPTKKEIRQGARALRSIAKWIRDMLKRHAKDPVSEVTEIDELKDFFGDEGEDGSGKGAEEINPYGDVILRAKPIKLKVQADIKSGNDIEGVDEGEGNEGGGGSDGAGGGDGRGGKGAGKGGTGGASQKSLVEIKNVRSVLLDSRNRRVGFTSMKTGRIALRLMEAGADVDYDTSIKKTTLGTVEKGLVVLDVNADSRVILDVELNDEFTGAVKVVANEV